VNITVVCDKREAGTILS